MNKLDELVDRLLEGETVKTYFTTDKGLESRELYINDIKTLERDGCKWASLYSIGGKDQCSLTLKRDIVRTYRPGRGLHSCHGLWALEKEDLLKEI